MTTPSTPPPKPAAPSKSGGGLLGGLSAKQKQYTLIGGSAILVVIIALYRKVKAQQTASTSPKTLSTQTSPPATGAAPGYDSTASDLYDALEPMLENLQNQIYNLQGTGVATTGPVAANPSPPAAATLGLPPSSPTVSTAPAVTALPVDSAGNNIAYNSQTGGSIQLGGASAPYANLPAGWSLRTIFGGDYPGVTGGQYAVPPGANQNPTPADANGTAFTVPGWQYVSSTT